MSSQDLTDGNIFHFKGTRLSDPNWNDDDEVKIVRHIVGQFIQHVNNAGQGKVHRSSEKSRNFGELFDKLVAESSSSGDTPIGPLFQRMRDCYKHHLEDSDSHKSPDRKNSDNAVVFSGKLKRACERFWKAFKEHTESRLP